MTDPIYLKCFHKHFPKQSLHFTCLQYKSFENALGKGEIACNEHFLLFPVFSILLENSMLFSSNSKLHLQTFSVWKSLTSVVWETINFMYEEFIS